MQRDAVFTVVTRNHLHYARTLMASVAAASPDVARYVVLCDGIDGVDVATLPFTTLPIGDLALPAPDRMVVRYTALELCTALKAWGFSHLLHHCGLERVVYLDADIELHAPLERVLAELDAREVLLTPHLTAPRQATERPTELDIMTAGAYNLGFIALRRGDVAARLVHWWQAHLEQDCRIDFGRGLFADQKWIDLVPGLFEGVKIVRDPGWNVAYWNLAQRPLAAEDGRLIAGGRPLVFFHFSGFVPGGASTSRFQEQSLLAELPPVARELFEGYSARLSAQGASAYRHLPYAFATLADGVRLPDCARRLYRDELEVEADPPRLDTHAGAQWLRTALNDHWVAGRRQPYTRLAARLWHESAELQATFPDIARSDAPAFARWFARQPRGDGGMDDAFLQPARVALESQAAGVNTLAPAAWRSLYRCASWAKPLAIPVTTRPFRRRVRRWLMRKA